MVKVGGGWVVRVGRGWVFGVGGKKVVVVGEVAVGGLAADEVAVVVEWLSSQVVA